MAAALQLRLLREAFLAQRVPQGREQVLSRYVRFQHLAQVVRESPVIAPTDVGVGRRLVAAAGGQQRLGHPRFGDLASPDGAGRDNAATADLRLYVLGRGDEPRDYRLLEVGRLGRHRRRLQSHHGHCPFLESQQRDDLAPVLATAQGVGGDEQAPAGMHARRLEVGSRGHQVRAALDEPRPVAGMATIEGHQQHTGRYGVEPSSQFLVQEVAAGVAEVHVIQADQLVFAVLGLARRIGDI